METIVIKGEGISLDLLLWRKHGLRGRELVVPALEANPGLAALGPVIPPGTEIMLPDLPRKTAPGVKLVTLFG